jgi:hypothetical protein
MKKIIMTLSLFSTFSVFSSSYSLNLDMQSYKDNITIKSLKKTEISNVNPYIGIKLVETDYKNIGDSKATLDPKTGLEWLDLTETNGMSITQVTSLLDSTFSGWRIATRDEVAIMSKHVFTQSNFTFGSHTLSVAATEDGTSFSNMFGLTHISSTYGTYPYNNKTYLFGIDNNGINIYSDHLAGSTLTSSRGSDSVFLVSNGGTTLSSKNNPAINIPE